MTIEIAAFRWAPPAAQGYVKDLRVRWALEEAALPYEAVLIDGRTRDADGYRAWQPFGQVPAYRDDDVEMFESGAIVLHIAAKSEALAPRDTAGWARVTSWVCAAMSTVEPQVQNFNQFRGAKADEAWAWERRSQAEARLNHRLAALSNWLGDKSFLETRFTAGDLMMATVLREVDDGLMSTFPTLIAYRERCLARPAFGRALEAQLETFRENAPAQ